MSLLEYSEQTANPEISSVAGTALVEIRSSLSRGHGLFATQDLAAGLEVMSCVAKDLTEISSEMPFSMAQYLFAHPDYFSEHNTDRRYLMVCGEMVFLNNCETANCLVSWVTKHHGLLYAQLRSKKPIRKDDELTIRYTDSCDYQIHGYF